VSGKILLSAAAVPAASLFGMAVAARNRLYDRRWMPVRTAPLPVISVGNLAVGGSGKTPLVLYLAERLLAAGVPVGVLTRGHGRRERRPIVLAPGGVIPPGIDASRIGDEPWMLRRRLGDLALGIDSRRDRAAGDLAPLIPGGILLLDDGFQHRQLERRLDLVVVAAGEPLLRGHLLPRGRMREPPRNLRRADHILVVAETPRGGTNATRSEDLLAATRAEIAGLAPKTAIAEAEMRLRGLRPLAGTSGGDRAAIARPAGPVAALAAIARPERLAASLAAAGIEVADRFDFPDHHAFRPREIERIAERARRLSAIVTTEKDEPRLLPFARSGAIGGVPVFVLVVDLVLTFGEEDVLAAVGAIAGMNLVPRTTAPRESASG
jgi:tetraacyldisaccharide 4'-kinase